MRLSIREHNAERGNGDEEHFEKDRIAVGQHHAAESGTAVCAQNHADENCDHTANHDQAHQPAMGPPAAKGIHHENRGSDQGEDDFRQYACEIFYLHGLFLTHAPTLKANESQRLTPRIPLSLA